MPDLSALSVERIMQQPTTLEQKRQEMVALGGSSIEQSRVVIELLVTHIEILANLGKKGDPSGP